MIYLQYLYGAHDERIVKPRGFLHCLRVKRLGKENTFLSLRTHLPLVFLVLQQDFII